MNKRVVTKNKENPLYHYTDELDRLEAPFVFKINFFFIYINIMKCILMKLYAFIVFFFYIVLGHLKDCVT